MVVDGCQRRRDVGSPVTAEAQSPSPIYSPTHPTFLVLGTPSMGGCSSHTQHSSHPAGVSPHLITTSFGAMTLRDSSRDFFIATFDNSLAPSAGSLLKSAAKHTVQENGC